MLNLRGDARVEWDYLYAERGRCSLDRRLDPGCSAQRSGANERYLHHLRRDLLEQLQPSGAHLRLEVGESGDVPAGVLAASVTLAASKPPGNDSQEYGQPSRS